METQLETINEDVVGVLRLDSNTGLVHIDFEPIPRVFEEELDLIISKYSADYFRNSKLLDAIKEHNDLNVLLKPYSYCNDFKAAYQQLTGNISELESSYCTSPNNNKNSLETQRRLKKVFINKLRTRLKAYQISITYSKCEEGIQEQKILAYSHRLVGWSNKPYQLNQNFLIHIKTNFGYGSVSYFFVRLRYKNIDIIGFHEWLLYPYAQIYEIVKYTKSFELKNESWQSVLEYSRDACNLSTIDEKQFVEKYIVQECERLVSGLENLLEADEFDLYNWNGKLVLTKMGGHKLVEFRGDKIAGALDFIEKITQFSDLIDIDNYITRIEECNRIIQPLLEKELPLLDITILELVDKLKKLIVTYEELKESKEILETKKSKFKQFMIDIGEYSSTNFDYADFNKRFANLFPNYDSICQNCRDTYTICYQMEVQAKSLHKIRMNIESSSKKIDNYFSSKCM